MTTKVNERETYAIIKLPHKKVITVPKQKFQ